MDGSPHSFPCRPWLEMSDHLSFSSLRGNLTIRRQAEIDAVGDRIDSMALRPTRAGLSTNVEEFTDRKRVAQHDKYTGTHDQLHTQ